MLAALALWALLQAIRCTGRWLRARRWERMLDDPEQAHLVPPLASHLLTEPSRRTLVGVIALGVVGVAMVVYGVLALAGRVPELRGEGDEEGSPWLIGIGVFCIFGAVKARSVLRAQRAAREVEELSNRPLTRAPTGAPAHGPAADGTVRRPAPIVPRLAIQYVGEPQIARRANTDAPLHMLYLRLFDNVAGTRRFVGGGWRRYGYVHVLQSADQVDADVLETAKDTGSVESLFIASDAELEDALRRQATGKWDEPMPTGFRARWRWTFHPERGKYPVRALLCHGSYWQRAVELLLVRMDLVVIDLTGYVPANAGTRFELQRAIDLCAVSTITLLATGSSDRRFLSAQINATWAQMADGSPNAGAGERTMTVVVDAAAP